MNTYYFLSGDVAVLVDSLITTISHIAKVGPPCLALDLQKLKPKGRL